MLAFGLLGLDVAGPVARRGARGRERGARQPLGLFLSAFAQTEFQAVQFMPAVVFPQILLCGLFVPRAEMATWLRVMSTRCR